MLWSKAYIPTLKEDPVEAEINSHKLMLRSGMLKKVGSGIYTLLPLGLIVARKVEQIVREEMNRTGALELLMPVLSPAELWKETGRWDVYGYELMRLKDRHKRDFVLGPTHEEIITDLNEYLFFQSGVEMIQEKVKEYLTCFNRRALLNNFSDSKMVCFEKFSIF